ncbi:MAG: VLRF1 family aeRF1-type release factor [Gemmatimonadota bacterium]|nr:VLRF1 family aeRF1-type release factor [Gemmatimonadota bacterium]
MIDKQDLQRLIDQPANGRPLLSLYLDMSVNSDNKRTYSIFLNQLRAQIDELGSGRRSFRPEEVEAALDRVERWIEDEFSEENRGVVVYTELGGDRFEALQFPVPVQNRTAVAERPVIAPLAQVLEEYHHHGVVLLDREHVRILSVYLGTLLDEIEVRADPIPTRHDVQAGGYSQQRFQRRKREEVKHFFRDFAREVEEFVRRYQPDDLLILGTDENVAQFREFLSEPLQNLIVHTGPMPTDEPAADVLAKLEPHLRAQRESESRETVEQVRRRAAQDYLATEGFGATLVALQEGKVDTLVIARDHQREGARCTTCGFVFAREVRACPYDGAETEGGVDVVEEMVRMAEGQGANVEFAEPSEVADLRGVGALLRF